MKKRNFRFISVTLIAFIMSAFLLGCSGNGSDISDASASEGKKRESALQILTPQNTGKVIYGNDIVSIDASNTSDGYIMLQYKGNAAKMKLQVTIPDGTVYTYTITDSSLTTFPLTGGSGGYHMDVLEHVRDKQYAIAFSQDMDVKITDEFKPFLYPNQYVWFTKDSQSVKLGKKLSDKSTDDLDYVKNVYHYVIENVAYDEKKAENTPTDYVPNLDETLDTGEGICFDYASLMAAMLRSQSVPTKLEVGYSGEAYHAWVSVYIKEKGWIDKIIEFDGKDWSLMDPTLAANNSTKSVGKYIGDGSNYKVKYSY
ncbi:transglutaminase-like domain-containing protein [Faecalicatena orotica]|uniref:transglutaminase-like domain-containing protein n=1 Tax=Faecalicatena orotica TaxID=1544 RepID=UPI003216C904